MLVPVPAGVGNSTSTYRYFCGWRFPLCYDRLVSVLLAGKKRPTQKGLQCARNRSSPPKDWP